MDAIAVIVVVAVAAELMNRLVFRGMSLSAAMGELFVGLRAEGWPVGVQEEDRDRPWGRSDASAQAAIDGLPEPEVAPVRGRVIVR